MFYQLMFPKPVGGCDSSGCGFAVGIMFVTWSQTPRFVKE